MDEQRESFATEEWHKPGGFLSADKFHGIIAKRWKTKYNTDWGVPKSTLGRLIKTFAPQQEFKRPTPIRGFKSYDVSAPLVTCQMDLIDMKKRGFGVIRGKRWILTIIDIYSRLVVATALPNKESRSVVVGLKYMLGLNPGGKEFRPVEIVTDAGKEFLGDVSKWLNDEGIKHRTVPIGEHTLLAIVNAFHMHFERRLGMATTNEGNQNWVSLIPDMISTYNIETVHSALKMTPMEAYLHEGVKQEPKPVPSGLAKAQSRFQIGTKVKAISFDQKVRGIDKPRAWERRFNPLIAIVSEIHRDPQTGLERYRLYWPESKEISDALFSADELTIVGQPSHQ